MTESIKVSLVPADEFKVDKKSFTWQLSKFEGSEITLALNFTNPEFISAQGIDTLKIEFSNTETYLEPEDPNFEPVTPGFEQVIKLPP